MRTSKYRGKTSSGKWMYGTPVYYKSGEVCIFNDSCPSYGSEATRIAEMRTNVIPETVGQFTGLFDKNGQEIYEGDILCVQQLEGTRHQFRGVMAWEEANACWTKFSPLGAFEVIGNIHDND